MMMQFNIVFHFFLFVKASVWICLGFFYIIFPFIDNNQVLTHGSIFSFSTNKQMLFYL